jgi:hypothetical protein
MYRSLGIAVVLGGIVSHQAEGAIVQLANSGGSQPVSIVYNAAAAGSLRLIFQIFNETPLPINALIWQLDLELIPAPGAIGNSHFQSAESPPNPIFPPVPGIVSVYVGSDQHLIAFDGDIFNENGQLIPSMVARNILELAIVADAGASGDFELWMNGPDPLMPTIGSSLLESGGLLPEPFGNQISGERQAALLATISIVAVPEASACGLVLIAAIAVARSHHRRP